MIMFLWTNAENYPFIIIKYTPLLSHIMTKSALANNKGADKPTHPRSLISTCVVRCLDSTIPTLATAKISRLANLCS